MLAVPPRRHRYVDLGAFKPVIRAYALGYASSTVPRLVGFLRMLRRKDKMTQEKIDLVRELYTSLNTTFLSIPQDMLELVCYAQVPIRLQSTF